MIFYSLNTYLELNYLWYFSVFFFHITGTPQQDV